MDFSPLGSSVHNISQARVLEWVVIPFSRRSSRHRDRTHVFCFRGGSLALSHQGIPGDTRELIFGSKVGKVYNIHTCIYCESTQSCPTFCDHMDYTVHGILQARILEWVAFPFSRGSSQSRHWTQVSCIAGRFFTSWATREAQEYWSG